MMQTEYDQLAHHALRPANRQGKGRKGSARWAVQAALLWGPCSWDVTRPFCHGGAG